MAQKGLKNKEGTLVRGGISTEMQRYAKANNPYHHDYDPEKETSSSIWMPTIYTAGP